MGNARWSDVDWTSYSSTKIGTSAASTYTSRSAKKEYTPLNIAVRESKISDANPNPTPIIIGLDQTGSMGPVIHSGISGLGTLFKEIYDRKPVSDPQILAMFIGDVEYDKHPLQATQFEADIKVAEQLQNLYVEGGGGGNSHESYNLPLYFALHKTDCDAFTQGRKGFIFTIGDEGIPGNLTSSQVKQVFGNDEPIIEAISFKTLVQQVSQNWHYFHLRVTQGTGYYASQNKEWTDVLGQHVLPLTDITKLSEVIVATIQVVAGEDAETVASTFSGSTAVAVRNATKNLTVTDSGFSGGIVKF